MFAIVLFACCALVGVGMGLSTPAPRARREDTRTTRAPREDNSPRREYLQARLAMLEDLQRKVEREYHNATGKQAISLQRQMITLDNQIWQTMEKIQKMEG